MIGCSLFELNLSHNQLDTVPPTAVLGGCFPQLELLSLASNRFSHQDDLAPLQQLAHIRQVGPHAAT